MAKKTCAQVCQPISVVRCIDEITGPPDSPQGQSDLYNAGNVITVQNLITENQFDTAIGNATYSGPTANNSFSVPDQTPAGVANSAYIEAWVLAPAGGANLQWIVNFTTGAVDVDGQRIDFVSNGTGQTAINTLSSTVSEGWHLVRVAFIDQNGGNGPLNYSGDDVDFYAPSLGGPTVGQVNINALQNCDGSFTDLEGNLLEDSSPQKVVDPSFEPTTIIYSDVCPEGTLTIDAGQNVNDNDVIATSVDTLDTNWASPASGQLEYAGTPDKVKLYAHVHQSIAQGANIQRAGPVLELYRNDSLLISAASGYIRDASDHEESSNTIVWVDRDPGANPVYEIRSRQEALAGAVSVVSGQFSAEACTSEPTGDEGGDDGATFSPLYDPANGKIVSDNFQDGNNNANFNLQVRNTTNTSVNWQACTPDVTYATIPNLQTNGANYQVVDNGDGTYKHCFDGTGLGGFQNITITGGLPNPPGQGGSNNLTLYCETA